MENQNNKNMTSEEIEKIENALLISAKNFEDSSFKWDNCDSDIHSTYKNAYICIQELKKQIQILNVELAKAKELIAEYKDKDTFCANSVEDMIAACDRCGLFECIGCEHSWVAVQEVKELAKMRSQYKDMYNKCYEE